MLEAKTRWGGYLAAVALTSVLVLAAAAYADDVIVHLTPMVIWSMSAS
jgi:hypothetical protein